MSATINEDATNSVSHQQGEIGSHVPRKGPETTHGVRDIYALHRKHS